jgi:hypothetical protein
MTSGATVEEIPGVRATPLPPADRTRLLLWVAIPVLIINFAAPYLQLIALPLVFFLKNRLHQSPDQVALFALIAASPTYFGWLFGFIRDRWSPFGGGDRSPSRPRPMGSCWPAASRSGSCCSSSAVRPAVSPPPSGDATPCPARCRRR